MKDGGWTFISHSHKDIDKVRIIRNELENRGFEPLIFYLKCLNDDDEIEELIKREIEERTWFIYVESENSKNSKWVQTEREYIKTLVGKKVFTIDISKDINEQLHKIAQITKQMKVFIAYSTKDILIYSEIKTKLLEKDMLVLDENSKYANDYAIKTLNNIRTSSREGFVLLILSEDSMKSSYILNEISLTMTEGGKIIVINVGGIEINKSFNFYLVNSPVINVSKEITDSELDKIVNTIMDIVVTD